MNCRNWEERIALYIEGDLPAGQATEAERHLAECAECREFAATLKGDLSILRAAHSEPIEAARFAAVRARVLDRIQRQRRPAWWLPWVAVPLAAAAMLFVTFRPRPVEPLPVALSLPPAPQIQPVEPAAEPTAPPAPPRRPRRIRPKLNPRRPPEPLMVKLVTDDPNVVIYWIAN